MRKWVGSFLALLLAVWPQGLIAQSCVEPGARVSVPRPDSLIGRTVALVAAFPESRSRVRVTRSTSNRLYFQMPVTDAPPGASFLVYSVPGSAPNSTSGTGVGAIIGGLFDQTRPDPQDRSQARVRNGGPPNANATSEAPAGDDDTEDDVTAGPTGPRDVGGVSDGGGGDDGAEPDDGGDGGGDVDPEVGDADPDSGDYDFDVEVGGGEKSEVSGEHEPNPEQDNAAGSTQAYIMLAPLRLSIDMAGPSEPKPLVLAQAGSGTSGAVGGGRICGASAGGGGESPMTRAEVIASLGLGAGRLPDDYRAGTDEAPAPSTAAEVVAAVSPSDRRAVLRLVEDLGGTVLREERLSTLGISSIVFDLAGAVTTEEFRALLASDGIDAAIDSNNIYGSSQGRRVYANNLVGAVPIGRCRLPRPVRIGLIDGPVDRANPVLKGVKIRSYSALSDGETAGKTDHATGVASLLAAQPTPQGFGGIAPGAELLSAEAFAAYRTRDAASVDRVSKSIDWLLGERASVINMSIAGPFNRVFQFVINAAAQRGAIMVAASGNDGAAQVAYPGADPNVIAVTAIDAAKRPYSRANYGSEVDFAAPGVDVLVAERTGMAYRTGTSYASAVLSGMVAHKLATQRGTTTVDRLRDDLRKTTEDLGDKGRDPRFGWGLARIPGCDF